MRANIWNEPLKARSGEKRIFSGPSGSFRQMPPLLSISSAFLSQLIKFLAFPRAALRSAVRINRSGLKRVLNPFIVLQRAQILRYSLSGVGQMRVDHLPYTSYDDFFFSFFSSFDFTKRHTSLFHFSQRGERSFSINNTRRASKFPFVSLVRLRSNCTRVRVGHAPIRR